MLQNNPQDWARLQVWDGNGLKPALDGFSGVPNEEQINMLYAHVQNKELFFFELGEPNPKLVGQEKLIPIVMDAKEPTTPQPPQSVNPTKQEKAVYAKHRLEYESALTRYQTAQELQQMYGSGFKTAVEGYQAGRNMKQDSMERASRDANFILENVKINRGRADRGISEMMAPKPIASPDVFFDSTKHAKNVTIHYTHFNEKLAPNG